MNTPPQTFVEFRSQVDQLLDQHVNPNVITSRKSQLSVLPPSVRHLADQAENVEAFHALTSALFPSRMGASRIVSGILRRGCFYHGILAHRSTESLWCAIKPYSKPRTVQLRELLLLDGCQFPFRKFSVLEWTIERFSQKEICLFGPPPQIAESFYPRERLDEHWFSQQWFLYRSLTRDEKPGATIVCWDYDVIENHWKPLLTLALYDPVCFAIPRIVESERGWRLRSILSGHPMIDTLNDEYGTEVPASFYAISKGDAGRFKSFIRFIESTAKILDEAKFIKSAARRYIRAMFITGQGPADPTDDNYEDALLQYVYVMEKILLASGEREGIADKIALRCAYLMSLEDGNRRKQVYDQVKKIYDQRSKIVHGTAGQGSAMSLDDVRGILRQLLVAILSFRMAFAKDQEWQDVLRYLPVSEQLQSAAIKASKQPLSLLE